MERQTLRFNHHIYYLRDRCTTKRAANKKAKSWQDYGSDTLIKPVKVKYDYPKETLTRYDIYATKKLKAQARG